jgi:hypothetical protein
VWIAALIIMFSALGCSNSQAPENPNFIIILVDDQGWAGTNVFMDEEVEIAL